MEKTRGSYKGLLWSRQNQYQCLESTQRPQFSPERLKATLGITQIIKLASRHVPVLFPIQASSRSRTLDLFARLDDAPDGPHGMRRRAPASHLLLEEHDVLLRGIHTAPRQRERPLVDRVNGDDRRRRHAPLPAARLEEARQGVGGRPRDVPAPAGGVCCWRGGRVALAVDPIELDRRFQVGPVEIAALVDRGIERWVEERRGIPMVVRGPFVEVVRNVKGSWIWRSIFKVDNDDLKQFSG